MNSLRAWIALFLLPAAAFGVDFAFEIPPARVAVEIAGQPVSLTVSGELSASPVQPGASDQAFELNLRADLGELQSHLTPLLQAELNRSDRCGERVSIQQADISPAAPAGNLTVHLHFEKWICIRAAGDSAKKLLGSDATVHVILTPHLETTATQVQTVRLDADIGTIEADGPLGELLRSGSVGAALRDKIHDALLKPIQKTTELEGVMPLQVKRFVTIQKVAFVDAGFGRLAMDMAGRMKVPGDAVPAVLEQFGNSR